MRRVRLGKAIAVVVGSAALIGGLLTFAGPAGALITGPPTVVTNPITIFTNTTATFSGTINGNGGGGDWAFAYGPTGGSSPGAYGFSTTETPYSAGSTTFTVTVGVTGLTPGTLYHVQLFATNGDGQGAGGDKTFTTSGSAPVGGPTVVTTAATAVTGTTATLNGTINPNGHAVTSYYFQWGINTGYGATTAVLTLPTGTTAVAVSANLTGLTSGQTYDFQLVATANSITNVGGNQSFVATATGAPVVVTTAATSVTTTSATLNGTINPGGFSITSYYFQWGTNTGYGFTTSPVGTLLASSSTIPVSANLTGLTSGQTYDYQLVATGSNAVTHVGGNQSFVAGGGLVITQPATAVTGSTVTVNGSISPGGVNVTYDFEIGTSPTLTTFTPSTTGSTGAVTGTVPVSANFTGLTPGTVYYFELVASTGLGGILSFVSTGGSQLTQLGGIDAIATSILISGNAFPAALSAGAVVLARSDSFSDALAGAPLAAAVGGPLLITPGTPLAAVIDPRVLAEIQRVLPVGGTVYILGGTLALSPNIDNQLTLLGYNVIRLAGINLYATAVLIAQRLGNPPVVFEATGLNYFDALSAVPAAIAAGAAILLTDGNVQAPETAAYLAANPGDTRYTIGGALAAGGADPGAINVSGADLYATSAAVAARFFPNAHLVGFATSTGFADALGGGLFMATGGRFGPLLIVNPNPPVPSEELAYLLSLAPGTPGYVFGGPLAVSGGTVSGLESAIG